MHTRNPLILIVIITIFASHHFPHYTDYFTINVGLNLKEGKGLLNNISPPKSVKHNLTETANTEFKALLNDLFSDITQTKRILLPFNDTNTFYKKRLKSIKIGNGFDFSINITAKITVSEVSFILISKIDESIDIYDLNSLNKFYSQSVISNLIGKNGNTDFLLRKLLI